MEQNNWEKIISKIKTPLGLASLGFLIAGSIVTFAINNLEPDNSIRGYLPIVIIIFFFLVLVLAFLSPDKKGEPNFDDLNLSDVLSKVSKLQGDKEIINSMTNMVGFIKEVLKIENGTFRKIIARRLIDYSHKMSRWEKGILHINKYNSRDLLVELYRNAENSVFSTSFRDFILHWKKDFGEQLIDAHKESSAKVIRVFIFNNRSEFSDEHRDIIEKQIKAGITAKLYFDEEDDSIHLDAETKRDYTIIDDKVLGITETFGFNDEYTSKWHFNDDNFIRKLNVEKEKLLSASKALENL